MAGFIIIMVLIIVIVGSLISGLILMGLGRGVAKIENAKYGNSFLVALVSSIVVLIFYFILGALAWGSPMEFVSFFTDIGFGGALGLNIAFYSVTYIPFGKLFWKTKWGKSAIANVIWIVIYAVITSLIYSNIG